MEEETIKINNIEEMGSLQKKINVKFKSYH